MEAALLSLTPRQVAEIAGKHPQIGAIWQRFKMNIERPIAAILILNTAAHTIGAAVAGSQFNKVFGESWIIVFSLVFTYLMLQFTEILPKTMGVRFNREVAIWIARPVSLLIRIFMPILHFVQWVNRPFEPRRAEGETRTTVEEITAMASLARLSNQITGHQERIIRETARLSRMRARDVMIPAEQVSFLSTSMSVAEALLAAHGEAHTRFPVCEQGDANNVTGYVNFKELVYFMRTNPNDPNLLGIVRPLHVISPDDAVVDLLRTFVDQHVHIAIVRDAKGQTKGLVTLEDLVEELVGELEDEFDRLPRMFHQLSAGTWMVGGGVPIKEVATHLGLDLEDADGTVSSWLIRRLGHVPTANQVYRLDDVELAVRRTRRGKVFEVAIMRRRDAETT
jgi:CBS domain containing-hemolysin-like protein